MRSPVRSTLILIGTFLAGACSKEPAPVPVPSASTVPAPASDPRLVRERAAAFFEKDKWGEARAALAPLAAASNATLEDLLDAAKVEFSDSKPEVAKALLERAAKIDKHSPALNYLRGEQALDAGKFAEAAPLFEEALVGAPKDLPSRLGLAEAQVELGNSARAEEIYKSVIAIGIENGTMWYVAAVYRLKNLLRIESKDGEAAKYEETWRELEKRGIKQPDGGFMRRGLLGRLRPPPPTTNGVAKPTLAPSYKGRATMITELAGSTTLLARDIDGDNRPDLVAIAPDGVRVALIKKDLITVTKVCDGPVSFIRAFDLENDGDLDLLVVSGAKIALYLFDKGAWKLSDLSFPSLPSQPKDILPVDYDHEGDLDLCVVGAFGARIWRNDGAGMPEQAAIPGKNGEGDKPAKKGQFTDATAESGLPTNRKFEWCASEDFDGDGDVDLLLGGLDGVYLADSLRAGRFADQSGRLPPLATMASAPIIADLDGDARPDLWWPNAYWHQEKDLSFRLASNGNETAEPGTLCAADLDLDGALDLAWVGPNGQFVARLCAGLPVETEMSLVLDPRPSAPLCACTADFDANGTIDLAVASEEGVRIFDGQPTGNKGKSLAYRGLRDNKRAVGAIAEMRTGSIYRRIYWRGEPELVGVGKNEHIDILRVTWPNGTVNTELALDLKNQTSVDDPGVAFNGIMQPATQVGSCPFLYSFDGQRMVFVSDVLGITPLGLQMEPGLFVPPDHDEYVLVKGEQLQPKDGVLELAFTEELREVTYLDHAKLIAVDHPANTEIFPNERFTFPPFPEAHTHSVLAPLSPTRAIGSDGKDWTKALAAIDDKYAVPFTLQPLQFAGLCQPWFVELSFDPKRVAEAEKLRLLCTGWFFWSDASANMAAARAPNVEFVPPIFQVPDGKGGWRDAGPPVGFPAGKTKTMVIDVSEMLDRKDPRIRVFTTLRLYWDAIRLATDDDDAPLATHELPVVSAKLWLRGFSAPLACADPNDPLAQSVPERFEWNELAPMPRWNQHPGHYTRYGDVLPLLKSVDDQYVILGSGDALTLRFDAKTLPAVAAGMRRDWLVYLDGWAKDRDPNTIMALEVEPLPFHAMSGYPYRADEHFPDDDAHKRWRTDWNTRAGLDWIKPISAVREAEWLLGR